MPDENNNKKPMIYLFTLLLAVAAASGLVVYLSRSESSATVGQANGQIAKTIAGGKFEASGVTRVPGTDAVLFVDDGKPGQVFWLQLDSSGNQVGNAKAIDIGISIEDPEGITTDGTHFYVVGSQSRPSAGNQFGLVRFKLDSTGQKVEAAETISDLKRLLVENVAELRNMANVEAKNDGINIEGLAWDPVNSRLLLGLRSPVVNGHALIVPLKLRDAGGRFSVENIEAKEMTAIRVSVGGLGIRSIEYDERSKAFQIIAGATESQNKTEFKLWEWSGGQGALRQVATLDSKHKPEGVTRASAGGSDFTFIVFDASRYQVVK
jgi:hypothetical protein